MRVHLGIDSTDSLTQGMCTTYVGAAIALTLYRRGVTFTDYPNLIRLNPNIPYKTRGNGAVALRVEVEEREVEEVFLTAKEEVEALAVFSDPQANPGIALLTGEVPRTLHTFYKKALHRLLQVEDAYAAAEEVGAHLHGYKNKRGVIGALAAIGETLEGDHTYEVLTYRRRENWGKKRDINAETVREMDQKIKCVFYNYDYQENTMCIAPHSACPVLAGIRGETPEGVLQASSLVDFGEPVFLSVLFRTNQHTSFHFEHVSSVSAIADYSSVIVEGEVVTNPVCIQGGHVFFDIENGGRIACAAFEPTKRFRDTVRHLLPGDVVRVYGGVKPTPRKTINLERIDVLTVKTSECSNPRCPRCGKSMTSKGKEKGFFCKKCNLKKKEKECQPLCRDLAPGEYEPTPSAWRHLYKMVSRHDTNAGIPVHMVEGWISGEEIEHVRE